MIWTPRKPIIVPRRKQGGWMGFYAAGAMGQGGGPPPIDPEAASIYAKLVSWWDFDSDLRDVMGANHLSGSGTYATGHIDNAISKSGRLEKNPALGMPNLSGSASGVAFGGWFYVSSTGSEDLVLMNGGSESYRIAFRSGNQVHLIAGNTGVTTISSSVGAVSVGNWYFVVGMIETVTRAMSLYIGTTLVASGTAAVGQIFNLTRITFGRVSGGVTNALRNDSTFIVNGLLDTAELAWLYNSGAGRSGTEFAALNPYPAAVPIAEGAWTWFNDSRALAVGSYEVLGCVLYSGVQRLYYSSDDWASFGQFDLGSTSTTPDDHDNPSLLRRSADGKLLAAYVRHNSSTYNLRVSTSADDPTAWGAATNIASALGVSPNATYANLVELPAESKFFNYFRNGASPGYTMHVSESTDGETWGAGVAMLGGGRPYMKLTRNGSARIDFLVTDGHPATLATSVYHFYYQGGAYYDSSGTALGSLPLSASSLTKLWDSSLVTGRAWVWDIIADAGDPVAVYSDIRSSGTDHRYRFARWDGAAWVQSQICTAGGYLYSAEAYYSGGVCIDPDDTSYVYAVRQVSGKWGLYRYHTTDSGATWDGGTKIYEHPTWQVFRPYIIPGTDKVFFCAGEYVTYNDFKTNLWMLPISR